jgi:glycosyltransferase involved in cell wall biosynthesis
MNILFYCDEYPPLRNGGIGSVTKVVAESLAQRGHTVVVVGNYGQLKETSGIADYAVINNVHVYRFLSQVYKTKTLFFFKVVLCLAIFFDFTRAVNFFKFQIARCKLRRTEVKIEQLIKDYQISIVELPDYQDELFHGLNRIVEFRKFSVPTIIRIHGSCSFLEYYAKQSISRHILQNDINHFNRADAICAVSEFSKLFVKQYIAPTSEIEVIYNPIEKEYFHHAEGYPEPKVILFFGKIILNKGVFTLIKSFDKIASRFPSIKLQLIGNGDIKFAQSLVADKFKDRIFFSGFMSKEELIKEIDKAYLCILPSYFENFSMAALEVLARKKALIYSKRSSGPELITEGETGWLVDPENVEELAEKMLWALNHPKETKLIAEKGFKHCLNHFSTEIIIPEMEKYYSSLINKFKEPETR